MVTLFAPLLLADGGAVLLHQEAPPYVVTVFASPAPPQAGRIDVSVLLQSAETLEAVLDAPVTFEFVHGDARVQAVATHGAAQNKMLYAASVALEEPGEWRYSVRAGTAGLQVQGVLAVGAKSTKLETYWFYLALPFVFLAVFALHQYLKLRRRY